MVPFRFHTNVVGRLKKSILRNPLIGKFAIFCQIPLMEGNLRAGLFPMLIRFGAANSTSIKEYQELSLVASSLNDEGVDLISTEAFKGDLLPFVVIYGANAAGKTNLMSALNHMAHQVSFSYATLQPNSKIFRKTFKLDDSSRTSFSKNDCDFILNGVRYHYGFTYDDDQYIEEWLYAYPEKVRQTWFYRRTGENITFGKQLRGRNRAIEDLTRPNSLFLSTAAQNNHAQLSPIYQFFASALKFDMNPSGNQYNAARVLNEHHQDQRLVEFLKLADIGIVGLRLESRKRPQQADEFLQDLKELMKKHVSVDPSDLEEDEMRTPLLGHAGAGASSHYFNLSDESRGTLRLVELVAPVLKALDDGSVLLIDEIDSSLHTLLVYKIIELFARNSTNPNGAQLIATTHDTNILCSAAIRRDQIWFAEKDNEGATCIYPLSDLRVRKTDNLEKGYIQGRFGAIPFIGSIERIVSEDAKSSS